MKTAALLDFCKDLVVHNPLQDVSTLLLSYLLKQYHQAWMSRMQKLICLNNEQLR